MKLSDRIEPRIVDNLERLQVNLKYRFREPGLLIQALTHPSVPSDTNDPQPDNQRLEFLGDAVLQLVLTHALFIMHENLEEGQLSKARACIVGEPTLAAIARGLELGSYLFLSHGEEINGGRNRASSLADAMEAVIGAVFLDGGYNASREFILALFNGELQDLEKKIVGFNPKGELQELLQNSSSEKIEYKIEAVTGPDHGRCYECSVSYGDKVLGRGAGKSKKTAEAAAATEALKNLSDKKALRNE
ncbi:MAG: ribonuclease III [Verrucomicrobia bacterium]|nr:ribonuclease III [Verrucomicrobiota bacterium]MCF7709233.1 ribonuclease III [Verrucomicrobiota bacterium]